MASIYTPYRLKGGKVVNVPNAEITKLQALLKITRSEAVEVWLSDNIKGYEHPQIKELTEKAEVNKVSHNAKAEYKPKTQRERVVKDQPIKEEIIATIAKSLESIGATQIEVTNKAKTITLVGKDGEPYAIDLKWERNKSKALKESKG